MSPWHPIPDAPAAVTLGQHPHILVIKLATLGDLLLATPALRALQQRYPEGRIDVLTTQESAPLLRESPLVHKIFTLDKHAFDTPGQVVRRPGALTGGARLMATLHGEHYDAALLLHHLTLRRGRLKYWALLKAIGARHSVGLDNGWGAFLDVRVPDHGFGERHEAEYCLDIAAAVAASVPGDGRGLRLADLGWTEGMPEPVSMSGARGQPPPVALHPGSGSYSLARRWPAERYAELAQAIHSECDAGIILVGGSEEQALHTSILEYLNWPEWVSSVAGTTPRELAGLLGRCALLVGNDSFPMHLAAATGIPVVAIFGPSNHRAWGPYMPDARGLSTVVRRTDLACSPCIYRGHALGTPEGCPPRPCLTELGIQPVLLATRRLLQQQQARASLGG